MPPQVAATPGKKPIGKKSIVVPSKIYSTTVADPQNLEGVEETEITAQITVPPEGGWGWVVVAASFMTIFVLDGVFFTFGSILHAMTDDLGYDESLVALINSVAVAVYFMAGPLVSALINRFGFRAICMSGSIISSMGLLCTYFASHFVAILLLYGVLGGFGGCLSSMASALVVGFYFEKLRSLTMSIASIGSSIGIMILFSLNSYVAKTAGWRVVMLMHSGLLGTIYFYGMTFRPLLSLTVTTTAPSTVAEEDRTRTVTYLPSLAGIKAPSHAGRESLMPSAAERLFSALSNTHFPTAAAVIGESAVSTPTQAGPSTAAASRFTLTPQGPQGGVSRRQLKQVQSLVSKSRASVSNKEQHSEKQIEINIIAEPAPVKLKWWQRLCHWEEHVAESRPMYRDDAFYEGRLDKLPVYQKSMLQTTPEDRTGLEYQMAVSRAVTAAELTEKRGVFTTAVRRTLATMMDPKLLKRPSFMLFCCSAFFTFLGYLVPYVFLPDKNKSAGIPTEHCDLFVSAIGLANAIGRPSVGALAMKVNPVILYSFVCILSGVSVMAFNFLSNVYYQYLICVLFGFNVGSLSVVRSLVIVDLYGLEMLTNATGMVLLSQGLGSLVSTPIAGVLKTNFGYDVSFYVAGAFLLVSGIVLIPIKTLNARETSKEKATPKKDIKISTKE